MNEAETRAEHIDPALKAADRKRQGSIRIDDQWRVCFRFGRGDAFDVEITDCHRG